MSSLEATFEKACSDGKIPGAVLMAANTSGTFQYAKAFGVRSLETKEPMQLDTSMWIASCTKLMTSIAAMQCVERGQFGLSDDVAEILPELAALPVIEGVDDRGKLVLKKRMNTITLRHLLTHSIGSTYDMMSPTLTKYKQERGQKPDSGPTVVERCNAPLLYEPGTAWSYGYAIDWAGKLVERITGQNLEEYMKKNIWGPLGISDITFWPDTNPDFKKRSAHMSTRNSEGKAIHAGEFPGNTNWEDCLGGQGGYATMEDYFKIVHSLLLDDEKLLKDKTTKVMFEPQLTEPSRKAMRHIFNSPELSALYIGDFSKPFDLDWGIGGVLIGGDEDSGRKKDTLIWSGMPNLFWFIDRRAGLCGLYGGQIMPPGDPQAGEMISVFEKAMYEKAATAKAKM